jgi:Cu-processing system ATP-binding protein
MLALRSITKRYGRFTALSGVDISFERGKMTALLGPNGSGKTTVIKTLLGLVRPQAGEVTWDDVVVNGGWQFRSEIGYMPQIAQFPENLTVDEFLEMIGQMRSIPPTRFERMMELFDLNPSRRKRLKALSGGTRQRVCAVMAFMFDVPVYILDEPTAGLDPLTARRLKDVVLEEKAAGKTIIFTSHILSDIEELADRLVFLLDGSLVFDGSLEDLLAHTGEKGAERAIASLLESKGGDR